MTIPRVLVVDDDDGVRMMMEAGLERDGFEVVTASNVSDALRHIATEHFDVLLSDLHMPLAGDGFTVVSAMRHANPTAVTLLLSAFPEMNAAAQAIMHQADEITTIDHALTRPWTVLKSYVRDRHPVWLEYNCHQSNNHIVIGNDSYFLSADNKLMPVRKGQTPPDLRYFK